MKKLFILLILLLLLTACGPIGLVDINDSPTATDTTPTPAEDLAASPDDDITADGTLIVPTPVPGDPPIERPLDDAGPWLLFYQRNERGEINEVYTANLDGTALTPILSPLFLAAGAGRAGSSPQVTAMEISPNENFLAVQIQYTPLNLVLWLLELPSGRVYQSFSMIGEEARFKLLEYYPGGYVPAGLPSLLPVSFLWSPDGRTIALSAAMDGPSTDIYTYNIEGNELYRLTAGPGEAVLMGWSPDGRWIVHQALSAESGYMRTSDGVYALSANGETLVRLYIPTLIGEEVIAGWVSDQIFISYTSQASLPSNLLREVDISTGKAKFLLWAVFSHASLVPETNQLIIDLFGFENWTPEIVPGVHNYDPDSEHFEKILPGGYSLLTWVPELGVFAAAQNVVETDILFFRADGEVLFSIPRSHPTILWPLPSPDGEWILTPVKDNYQLYNGEGNLILETYGLGQVVWLPDSSGFIQVGYNNMITKYLQINEWAPEIINPEFSMQGEVIIISQ